MLSVIPDGFGEAYTCKRCDERGQPAAPDPGHGATPELDPRLEAMRTAAPDQSDAEIARLQFELQAKICECEIADGEIERQSAEVARLKEALAAERSECNHRRERAEAAEQKLAEAERDKAALLESNRGLAGMVDAAEARVRELEAELARRPKEYGIP